MEAALLIKQEIVHLNMQAANQKDLFEQMFRQALHLGYVKNSFLKGVMEREAVFPTGLKLNNYSIAIPHTDPEHVVEQFIGIAILDTPVSFALMDDHSKTTDVKLVFLLGLNQPHSQLAILQELMQVIQMEENLERLLTASDCEQIKSVFEDIHLQEKQEVKKE